MDPVEAPESICRKFCGSPIEPVFVDRRNKAIHKFWHVLEVWGQVVSHVDRLFSEASAELGNVGHCNVVERPKRVLIKCSVTLDETKFDAGREKIVLADQVLLQGHTALDKYT